MVPIGTESTGPGAVPEDDLRNVSKATGKCKVKSSAKSRTAGIDNPPGRQKPNEVGATTDIAMTTGGGDAPTTPPVNSPMLNQAREMVCRLFNQSKILDDCRVRVAQAMGLAVSRCSTQLFFPFTSYLSSVFDTVEAWNMKIMMLHLEMANCDYDTYRNCAVEIWEKTGEYFGKLHDLNTTLEQQTLTPKPIQTIKPSDEHDSGMGSSTASPMTQVTDAPSGSIPIDTAPTHEDNPFPEEIMSIMNDVESSVGRYVQAMTKAVAEHLGGVEVTSYLGHIFSTGLNFQMLMWQSVMTEAIYLPTMMREHLRRETEMLWLFAEVIPILVPCSIPPPPFPTSALTPSASQDISGTSVGGPSLPLLPGDSSVITGMRLITLVTPSSGGTQPGMPLSGRQKLQSRISLKLLSCSMAPVAGAWEGVNKVVVCVTPSPDAQKSIDLAAVSPLLMNITQSSSTLEWSTQC